MTVRPLRPLVAALLLLLPFAGAARAAVPPLDTLRFAPAELREDFAIARHAYEEGHPGLYRFASKREVDRVFVEAARKLDHPMTATEFWRVLAPVVASLRCGEYRAEITDTHGKGVYYTRSRCRSASSTDGCGSCATSRRRTSISRGASCSP